MILQPGVIALLVGSLGTTGLLLYAAGIGVQVLRGWDAASGSERQLGLERKTVLVSSIVALLLVFQVLTLALFVYTADALHPLFSGSMCAVGTLSVNPYGYPALLAKLSCTMLSGIWLVLNRADALAPGFPLTRAKFAYLLVLAPLATLESGLLATYFSQLKPDVITSCCGTLFDGGRATIASILAGMQPVPVAIAFYLSALATVACGVLTWRTGRGSLFLAAGSVTTFVTGIVALISFFTLYYYEMPNHHCPFCLLQPEYHRIGFALYGLLLAGGIAGTGCGVLQLHREKSTLAKGALPQQRRLAFWAALSFAAYLALVTFQVCTASFRLS